jgi:hypothetical protein
MFESLEDRRFMYGSLTVIEVESIDPVDTQIVMSETKPTQTLLNSVRGKLDKTTEGAIAKIA